MQRNGRRLLLHPDRVRAMFAHMRQELEDQHNRHLSEMTSLYRDLGELRAEVATLRELRAATLAGQGVEAELASLYRERAIVRAKAIERDPSVPLQ